MSLVLFHRTSIADAREIAKHGFEDQKWAFGYEDVAVGEVRKAVGVWFSDRPLAAEEGPTGDALLEIVLDVDEEVLAPFELEGVVWDARLWVVPAGLINPHAAVRILGVDPRTSWWYEAQGGDDGPA